jgi:hypothetical protein
MNKTPKPADPRKTTTTEVAQPTHVRTAEGYKTLSAGLMGPANPCLTQTQAEQLKVILFG